MIAIPGNVRVWLATGHTDMRRGFPSLHFFFAPGSRCLRASSRLTFERDSYAVYFLVRMIVFLLAAIAFDLDLDEAGLMALMSCRAIGEPRPVHASQPAPAAKLPLLPWTVSRKAGLP
jgi:hypothetical protein